MAFSEQEKLEEFSNLCEFLNDIKIAAEIVPKGIFVPETTMVVSLPSSEDYDEDEEITFEQVHLASCYLVDLDDTEDRVAKYLFCIAQIPVDLSSMNVPEILLMLNELNTKSRIGYYFLTETDDKQLKQVNYRVTIPGVAGEFFDEGVVADVLFEMGTSYEIAKEALVMANEKCKKRG